MLLLLLLLLLFERRLAHARLAASGRFRRTVATVCFFRLRSRSSLITSAARLTARNRIQRIRLLQLNRRIIIRHGARHRRVHILLRRPVVCVLLRVIDQAREKRVRTDGRCGDWVRADGLKKSERYRIKMMMEQQMG